MNVLAEIASGELDWADIFFLIAVIVFVIVAVLQFMKKSLEGGLLAVGLAAVALGLLLL